MLLLAGGEFGGVPPMARHQWQDTNGKTPMARHQWQDTNGKTPMARHQWQDTHVCAINHEVSAGKMETVR